jgi:hypothetical protein
MGKATIEQFPNRNGVFEGLVPPVTPTNVTTSGTAANTDLSASTEVVRVYAEDTNERVAIGASATATANSVLVPAGTEIVRSVPKNSGWRVSIINA